MEHQLDTTITVLLISQDQLNMFRVNFCPSSEAQDWDFFTTYGIKSCWYGRQGFWALQLGTTCTVWRKLFARNMLSWSWRSIKLLLLHLVGVPYYFTCIDDARSNTNHVYITNVYKYGVQSSVYPKHRSCNGTPPRKQTSYATELPCSGRDKRVTLYINNTPVHKRWKFYFDGIRPAAFTINHQ
jgi:hypothetical protein